MTSTATYITRIRATLDSLLDYGPEHFDMDYWFYDDNRRVEKAVSAVAEVFDTFGECGTTACFAGHAALAAKILRDQPYVPEMCSSSDYAEWLGMANDNLFFLAHWPEHMRERARMDDEWSNVRQWVALTALLRDVLEELGQRREVADDDIETIWTYCATGAHLDTEDA